MTSRSNSLRSIASPLVPTITLHASAESVIERCATEPRGPVRPESAAEFVGIVLCSILPDGTPFRINQVPINGGIQLSADVPPGLRRFVIGRSGETIISIRSLLRAWNGAHKQSFSFSILDDMQSATDGERY